MEYNFSSIETKWQQRWNDRQQYAVTEDSSKPKYYVLDMFPYPSGAGLHVGHPLGYIASDIFARYKQHQGFNVLHPMGYDSFGLPAEQYAIETGQHPALTTEQNIARYRGQLDKLGFSYDWSREVRTSDPEYYRWTQWIFAQLFDAWYNTDTNRAEPIATLIERFETNGSYNVNAAIDEYWYRQLDLQHFPQFSKYFEGEFTATDWKSFTEAQKQLVLMHFRLTYLADSVVNWCPALGTVLANDEVVNGRSERGGHPVEQKLMRQWMMRITAYAERLLTSLDTLDWSDSLKEIQRNWIGRSEGARVVFALDGWDAEIEVFTTRPDTIFGVDFMVLAPEHPLVAQITSSTQKQEVEAYIARAAMRSERERMGEAKEVSGCFTGAYAVHPLTGRKLPVWIAEYVLASYGTGAIMAVPAGDERDWKFARHFNIPITNIFGDNDLSEGAVSGTDVALSSSDFLDGLKGDEAKRRAIEALEEGGVGRGKINYRLRDAVFSRQRYWGEPFPVQYADGLPQLVNDADLPIALPEVDKYLPTESGEPPLARAKNWVSNSGHPLETNTMPGWAGSSWYFLRYMDPHNTESFCDRSKSDYWGQVDFYMGGAEHATGHLLYSRFWTKVLHDLGHIGFDEPFKKLVNQGMIQGRSSFVHRVAGTNSFVSADLAKEHETQRLHVDISLVDNDKLDTDGFRNWRSEYANAEFITNDAGDFVCDWEIEKMSKSKYNVQTPDELVEKFGADTLRCYEMFLGPVEQHKPWDTKGINGVHNFLRKLWRLYHTADNTFNVSDEAPTSDELRTLHKTIKKVTEDLDRLSWNTVVSAMMICVNELTEQKCNKRGILEVLPVLLSPYAPHISEELWELLGHSDSVTEAAWPSYNEDYLVSSTISYPVQFNGKMRFNLECDPSLPAAEVEKLVLAHERTAHYLEGKAPRKVIVVPGRIINIVA
jgi:leucyl-tRNA synthetase